MESRSVTPGWPGLPSALEKLCVLSGFTVTIRSVSWLNAAFAGGSGPGPGTTSTIVPVLAVVANGWPPAAWTPTSRLRVTVVVMATLPMLPGQRALQVAVDGVGVGTWKVAKATPRDVSPGFGLKTREMYRIWPPFRKNARAAWAR